ncbi:MAG: homocysteine S-methyltransferase family protein [Ignavibacterium sp.]|jgi:5-methyltetrahydrofolate--homocysteine methyltransferase|nr:homocysteine S-methyltransferase family protein [Ignavibacterium sp.]
MNKISDIVKKGKLLTSDGAWGTYLFKKGLASGSCPEEWNLTHYDDVYDIARSYILAGSDIISTNSFGSNYFKLSQYNLQEKLSEICQKATEISRKAAGNDKIVMASIGPTGKFLVMGDVTSEDLYNSFKHQAVAFEKGGADAVCIETFYDVDEARAAINAVKENTSLEVICTFTFDKSESGYKTLMGVSPHQMAESLIAYSVDIIGANCGTGYKDMIEITKMIREFSINIPIIIQANAGLPVIENGQLIYSETPERIKEIIPELIDAGANIIGGCCGTTPEHIKVISEIVGNYNQMRTN